MLLGFVYVPIISNSLLAFEFQQYIFNIWNIVIHQAEYCNAHQSDRFFWIDFYWKNYAELSTTEKKKNTKNYKSELCFIILSLPWAPLLAIIWSRSIFEKLLNFSMYLLCIWLVIILQRSQSQLYSSLMDLDFCYSIFPFLLHYLVLILKLTLENNFHVRLLNNSLKHLGLWKIVKCKPAIFFTYSK